MVIAGAGVSFRYGRRTVFDGLDVEFPTGRTVLLGPNGAGKSTLLAVLADALQLRSGAVLLEQRPKPGRGAGRRAFRRAVAWLPQSVRVFPGLTVREHVAYTGWLKGLSRAEAWAAAAPALTQVDLTALADRKATQLSGGQARRMGIAGALAHGARVLLLDEPTAGLDPDQRERFRGLLQQLPQDLTVVVSTHQTEDVADAYDRVAVLVAGRVPFTGTLDGFVSSTPEIDMRDRIALAYRRYVQAEA